MKVHINPSVVIPKPEKVKIEKVPKRKREVKEQIVAKKQKKTKEEKLVSKTSKEQKLLMKLKAVLNRGGASALQYF